LIKFVGEVLAVGEDIELIFIWIGEKIGGRIASVDE
jgi:hypothetical protein